MKNSEINFKVSLDDNNMPETISWKATDSGVAGEKKCKAALLAIWDEKENTTLRIDLWTKDMYIEDMKRFFFENMMSMADTYERATNDSELAAEIRTFSNRFGERAKVVS